MGKREILIGKMRSKSRSKWKVDREEAGNECVNEGKEDRKKNENNLFSKNLKGRKYPFKVLNVDRIGLNSSTKTENKSNLLCKIIRALENEGRCFQRRNPSEKSYGEVLDVFNDKGTLKAKVLKIIDGGKCEVIKTTFELKKMCPLELLKYYENKVGNTQN